MHAVAAAICVLMINTGVLFAQDTARVPVGSPDPAPPQATQKPEDVQRGLPVSLDRIRMELAATPPATTSGGMRLNATVEVVGKAPPIELWDPAKTKEVLKGPAPFGPPTANGCFSRPTRGVFAVSACPTSSKNVGWNWVRPVPTLANPAQDWSRLWRRPTIWS